MKKTIGILAHVDAGKTTLCESILYHTKAIKTIGRVDHKNSFLDNDDIEKERGITIFSEGASFKINDSTYYLIDTPGHVDFSSEMERALSVLDYAILIISGGEGIQSHTETLMDILKKYKIPTFIFINKIDREGYDRESLLDEINKNFKINTLFIKDDIFAEDVKEAVCETDEELLEDYLEDKIDLKKYKASLIKAIKDCSIYPCFEGSALKDIGIESFLNNLDILTETNYISEGDFKGKIYKIKYDEKKTKLTFIKALEGRLKVRDEINLEKVSSIRLYNGNKFITKDYVEAGDVFAVTGLNTSKAGEVIGDLDESFNYNLEPSLISKVIYPEDSNVKEVLSIFQILDEEDPSLKVIWNEDLKEIHIHIMGKIQLEVLKELLKNRFDLQVDFGPCKILYKETIKNTVIGSGHFEPLRHYAEVHLLMEPGERNKGITFESRCHVENLNTGYQNLIRTHIFEREHKGILTGFPITDIKFTLINGRSHLKHTSGGDFREAVYRAIRQGLEEAENVLLEPYYKFKIKINNENIGRVLSDIQKLNGEFYDPVMEDNKVIINGRGPVKTFMDYGSSLIAFTKGTGSISFVSDGYDICHNADEVIKEIGYDKKADREYTSSSVFCSKGQGYIVEWDKVKEHIHCNLEE